MNSFNFPLFGIINMDVCVAIVCFFSVLMYVGLLQYASCED